MYAGAFRASEKMTVRAYRAENSHNKDLSEGQQQFGLWNEIARHLFITKHPSN